ncbi:MAG: S8 family serine peptidase [Flavobacteriaceae bacterium]|nr:S8 family serine peptidase [Flavobacteriaceae bacterium]
MQVSWGQTEDAWVYFKDKPQQVSFLENPLKMLSPRAIERRKKQAIPLDFLDVPISLSYINELRNQEGIKVLAKSKWMNALHIRGTVPAIKALLALGFVETVYFANSVLQQQPIITNLTITKPIKIKTASAKLTVSLGVDYGKSLRQLEMLKGEVLHRVGFKGAGMQIAVMDAGFPKVDELEAFSHLFENNQLLGGYNFVDRNTNIYTNHSHGQLVLSTMAGQLENEYIGTAPEASYYLFITEDAQHETPLEESLWVEAAEKADSLGVDIITTSLGYTTFDNSAYNYSYSDLDGKTAFMSKAATIAFSKGIFLVNAAGNSGNTPWKYIGVPADAIDILSVGAVNSQGEIAAFSSYGPSSDGRIKPTVCAQGEGAYVIRTNGTVSTANGTSFSGPIMAGMVACLWQSNPSVSNTELMEVIKKSAHLFENPTAQEGYGIPDFEKAMSLLNELLMEDPLVVFEQVYPNPSDKIITIPFKKEEKTLQITIVSIAGKKLIQIDITREIPTVDIRTLTNGLYIIQVQSPIDKRTYKLIKK